MNFEEFTQEVVEYFRDFLGGEYSVSLNNVCKNNNTRLCGLLMKRQGQKITPNIYLNGYYEEYIEKGSCEAIYTRIWDTYEEALSSFDERRFDFELDFESQKDKVIYRLINFQENQEKLEQVPYIRFLDLAITFHCFVNLKEDTISLLPVTNQMMEHWETDKRELFCLANENTKRLFPPVFHSLENLLRKLVGEQELEVMLEERGEVEMYVVSNTQGINGATVLLYEKAFHEIAKSLGEKVYILPSSIHEVIVIPYNDSLEGDKLLSLVQEVNLTQVPIEEVLSNHVYLYDSILKKFDIL